MKQQDLVLNYTGYIPSVIVALIAVLVLVFVVWPNIENYPVVDTQIKETTDKVAQLTRQKSALEGFSDAELEEITTKTNIALPTQKSFPGLLSGLEFLASQANSQLVSFDSAPGVLEATMSGAVRKMLAEEKLPAGMGGLNASVGVNSNSANLIDLTKSLVKSGRLVSIEKVSFDSLSSKGQNANTTIDIKVYYQPKPANSEDIAKLSPITPSEKAMVERVDSLNKFTLKNVPDLPTSPDPFASLAAPTRSSSPSARP